MANYKYSVRDASGKVQNGTLSSESLEAAASILRGQGLRIVNIAPVVAGIDKDKLFQRLSELNAGKPKTSHILDFTTQLAVMMRAGINLRSALEGIADHCR